MTTEPMKLVWLSDDALAKVWGRDSTPTVITSTKCAANQHAAVLTKDMPVGALETALNCLRMERKVCAELGDNVEGLDEDIAALERLLGVCE